MDLAIDFVVRRPVGEVFGAWADLERAPEWAAPVLERRKLTDGPVGPGTRLLARDRFPGRTIDGEKPAFLDRLGSLELRASAKRRVVRRPRFELLDGVVTGVDVGL